MVKMQGAEDEGAGSVLKYMTKPESDSNAADWPLWHADLLTVQTFRLDSLACCLWLIQPNLVQIYYWFWRSRMQPYANVWLVLAKRVASPPIVISFLAR